MQFRDIADDAAFPEQEIRNLLLFARDDSRKSVVPEKVAGMVRVLAAALLAAAMQVVGAPLAVTLLVAVAAVGVAVTMTVNAWGAQFYPMLIYLSDLGLKLHEREIETAAELAERVATVRRARRRDDLDT